MTARNLDTGPAIEVVPFDARASHFQHDGLPALIRDDVPIGRLSRALASEGLAFTARGNVLVIHPREGK